MSTYISFFSCANPIMKYNEGVKKEIRGKHMAFYESLKYTVVKKEGKFQIRQYDTFLLASAQSNVNPKQDSGFNQVFRYISGHNSAKTKFSMTTPVVTYEEKNLLVTGFYLPSHYQKETLPVPLDKDVFINEMVQSTYAVIRFRGRWSETNFAKNDKLLQNYIEKSGYEIDSNRFVFRYQPPFFPPFLRHNEIAYIVKEKGL